MTGIVTHFVNGWGFVRASDGEDYFLHHHNFVNTEMLVAVGNVLEFEVRATEKRRPEAVGVRKVEKEK